jgi:hypothetical protein
MPEDQEARSEACQKQVRRRPEEKRSPQETGFEQKHPKDVNRTIHTENVVYQSARCNSARETESVVISIDKDWTKE